MSSVSSLPSRPSSCAPRSAGTRGVRRAATTVLAVGLAVVTVACGSGAATNDESTRDESGAVVEAGEVGALRLKVGDCLATQAIGQVESVPVVPCSEVHDSEIYHAFDLVGEDFPGDDEVVRLAGEGCLAAFEGFIGMSYEASIWDIRTIYPTEVTWNAVDDREVLCAVYPVSDEDTTGSARGVAE